MQFGSTIRKTWRPAWRTALIAGSAIVLAMAGPRASAQISSYGAKGLPAMNTPMGQPDTAPNVLKHVGILQHLNYPLPLNLTFADDAGKTVPLSAYFGKVPVILMLVYYRCPMLCSEELEGLASALKMIDFRPGKDFNIVAISIDPAETPAMAAEKKAEYLKMYGHPETAGGWHFMTGTQA